MIYSILALPLISNFRVTSFSWNKISVKWNLPTSLELNHISKYYLSIDNPSFPKQTYNEKKKATSFSFKKLKHGQLYTMTIWAVDQNGKVGPVKEIKKRTIKLGE